MTHTHGKIGELRARAQRRGGSFYDRMFTRRISIFVTAALYPLGVAPNSVSFANTLVGLAGWLLVGSNTYPLIGVLLVHLWAVLDSVDGELARLTRRFSLKGLFLEDHGAYVMINAYWLAMGWYLAQAIGRWWPLWLCAGFVVFGRLAMPAARRALMKSVETGRPHQPGAQKISGIDWQHAPTGLVRFVFVDALHPTNMWAVTTIVLVFERWWLGSHYGLLVITMSYLLLCAARELGILWRFLSGDTLDEWLENLYLCAAVVPQREVDPLVLAGDGPRDGSRPS